MIKIYFTDEGNVGIGDLNPTSKFSVVTSGDNLVYSQRSMNLSTYRNNADSMGLNFVKSRGTIDAPRYGRRLSVVIFQKCLRKTGK
ncbi:hypothetical protein PG637_10295 [Riemerella anatipestifer]|uniref:hypothetical protein n=1 Tax=Riemerella anatipestifer TaxID=34085 RepID=UPI001626A31F|nr:hypothetical protein [Riemerella anatipestifer]MDY3319786.1 hypothetical protein [Riemerella anatipestifer]MDY3326057.1 hypothetical protein [Riemerella anatipestifer]MDY3354407.1 hypothetical protein [Riemerella anatipestifer]